MFVGADAIAMLYESVTAKRLVIERIRFNEARLGVSAEALYTPLRA